MMHKLLASCTILRNSVQCSAKPTSPSHSPSPSPSCMELLLAASSCLLLLFASRALILHKDSINSKVTSFLVSQVWVFDRYR